MVRLASQWLVEVYYKELCYEDDTVDFMAYLVDAACHPEWGVDAAVADLLVKITARVGLTRCCGSAGFASVSDDAVRS